MYSLIQDIKWENDEKSEKLIFVKKATNRLCFQVKELGLDPEVWTHEKKEKTHKGKFQLELIFQDLELTPELLAKFGEKPLDIGFKNLKAVSLGCMGDDSLTPIYIAFGKNNQSIKYQEDSEKLVVMLS